MDQIATSVGGAAGPNRNIKSEGINNLGSRLSSACEALEHLGARIAQAADQMFGQEAEKIESDKVTSGDAIAGLVTRLERAISHIAYHSKRF